MTISPAVLAILHQAARIRALPRDQQTPILDSLFGRDAVDRWTATVALDDEDAVEELLASGEVEELATLSESADEE